MKALFYLVPVLLFVLWLGAIRPYLLRRRQAPTTGVHWGFATFWIDWQKAMEVSKKEGSGLMLAICRFIFVLLFAWVAGFFGLVCAAIGKEIL